MRVTICCVFIFLVLGLSCNALNCRSDTGPKENELKSIYANCLKRQDHQGRNYSRNRNYGDDDWRDPIRGYNQRDKSQASQWDRDERGNRDDKNRNGYFDDMMGGQDDRNYNGDQRTSNRGDRMNREDRMGYGDGRMGKKNDRMDNRNERFGTVDERTSNDRMERYGYGRPQVSRQDRNDESDEYDGEITAQHNIYHSSTQTPRRYKRERRLGASSGQRSRYNPNRSNSKSTYEDKNDEKNASMNGSSRNSEKNKACALHCFMENLEMTGDNGMPDKYLVTHVITKDIKDEDLRDFLQESIEECFQILGNENTEDKCEFSKNLLLCLSEKGRANCDDWKEDIQF